jgi:hypothetical protein
MPFKKDDFFFNRKEKRIFLAAVRVGIGVAGVCVLILIIVAIVASIPKPESEAIKEPPLPGLMENGSFSKQLSINSFIIPDETRKVLEPEYSLFRERVGAWNDKMIEKYWIPPSQIGLENLKKTNDKNIERMFDEIK